MNTAALDANIVLRYLVRDIPSQYEAATKKFLEAKHQKIRLVIFPFTIAEVVYLLEGWYKKTRSEAVESLLTFLNPDWIEAENKDLIIMALNIYKTTPIDFTDVLLFVISQSQNWKILSFDKDFDKLSPKLRLEP